MDLKLRQKHRAQKFLDLIVDYSLTTSMDAGWHQNHMMASLIQYGGDIPRGAGLASGHDSVMLNAVSKIRNKHPELNFALERFGQLKPLQQLVLYIHTRFRKVAGEDGKLLKERDLAAMAGLTRDSFIGHRRRAMKAN